MTDVINQETTAQKEQIPESLVQEFCTATGMSRGNFDEFNAALLDGLRKLHELLPRFIKVLEQAAVHAKVQTNNSSGE